MTTLNIVGKIIDNKVYKKEKSNNHFNDCYFELEVPRNFSNDIGDWPSDKFIIHGWSGLLESVVNNSKKGDWVSLVGRIEVIDSYSNEMILIAENITKLI